MDWTKLAAFDAVPWGVIFPMQKMPRFEPVTLNDDRGTVMVMVDWRAQERGVCPTQPWRAVGYEITIWANRNYRNFRLGAECDTASLSALIEGQIAAMQAMCGHPRSAMREVGHNVFGRLVQCAQCGETWNGNV